MVWTETYFPTLGLSNVVSASEYGALDIYPSVSGGTLSVSADAFSTAPGETVAYIIKLEGASSATLKTGSFTASPSKAEALSASYSTSGLASGNYRAVVILSNSAGVQMVRGEKSFSL